MATKQQQRQKANTKNAKAQQEEQRARESQYPDHIHEDTAAAREALSKRVEAEDELYKLQEEERLGEELDDTKVTLVAPSEISVTDSSGLEFVDGKAQAPKYLAERYVESLEGYSIQGSKSSSK